MRGQREIFLVLQLIYLGTISYGFGIVAPFSKSAKTKAAFSLRQSPTTKIAKTTTTQTSRLWAAEEETEASSEESEEESEETKEELDIPSESPTDILNSPAFLQRKLEVLQGDLATLEEKSDALLKTLETNKAEWAPQFDELDKEYSLMQERMTKQSKEGDGAATIEVARKLLDVMDNFDRAFNAVNPETDEEKEIDAAYRKTYEQILNIFQELGITEVETIGKEFDYEVHQAVMQRPSDDYEEGIVCDELAKGYVMGDKLIRAAMVSVAA